MTRLTILEYPDPRLRTRAVPVDAVDAGLRDLIDDMFETMYAAKGIGLAATQVDVHRRLLVADVSEVHDDPRVFINPEILSREGSETSQEGCLSVPGYYDDVERAERVRVRAMDRNGVTFEAELDGLLAICVQHEIDHLDGKLFVDYLSEMKRQRVRKKIEKDRKLRIEGRALEPSRTRDLTGIAAMEPSLAVVFAGTPDFALPSLDAIAASSHRLVAVCTQPDRRSGRGQRLAASPVKERALALGLPVLQPATLRDGAARDALAAFAPDVMVVVAYGLLLPPAIIELPRLGCLNVHASLLPRWRGAAPVARAIMAGDATSGVCIMRMEAELDTGPVMLRCEVAIGERETAGELEARLADAGGSAIVEALDALAAGCASFEPQDSTQATYAAKLGKADARLDWREPARVLERRIRALNPRPVAESTLDGAQLRIYEAEIVAAPAGAVPGTILGADAKGIVVTTGDQALALRRVQLPGRREVTASELANARPLAGRVLV